jgi:hypothetical protein
MARAKARAMARTEDSEGCGSGYGSGYGYDDGSEEARKKIELNILSHIPDKDLPLYLGAWEFAETKKKFEDLLKGYEVR